MELPAKFILTQAEVKAMKVDRNTKKLPTKGETLTLKATVKPSNATFKNIEWTSSNEAVAK